MSSTSSYYCAQQGLRNYDRSSTPTQLQQLEKKMRKLLVAAVLAFLAAAVFAKTITIALNKKELDTSDSKVAAWYNMVRISQKTGGVALNRPYLKTSVGAAPNVPLSDFADTQVSTTHDHVFIMMNSTMDSSASVLHNKTSRLFSILVPLTFGFHLKAVGPSLVCCTTDTITPSQVHMLPMEKSLTLPMDLVL